MDQLRVEWKVDEGASGQCESNLSSNCVQFISFFVQNEDFGNRYGSMFTGAIKTHIPATWRAGQVVEEGSFVVIAITLGFGLTVDSWQT
jgi:hypothetical protein